MPRPRKYDYKDDLPVKLRLFITLPVRVVNKLEELGFDNVTLSKEVEKYLINFVEKNSKKD